MQGSPWCASNGGSPSQRDDAPSLCRPLAPYCTRRRAFVGDFDRPVRALRDDGDNRVAQECCVGCAHAGISHPPMVSADGVSGLRQRTSIWASPSRSAPAVGGAKGSWVRILPAAPPIPRAHCEVSPFALGRRTDLCPPHRAVQGGPHTVSGGRPRGSVAPHHLRTLLPPNSCKANNGVPFCTCQLAHVCCRSCQRKSSIPARVYPRHAARDVDL